MKEPYKRFWFEFEVNHSSDFPPGVRIGCGVNALDYEDAIKMMDQKVFSKVKRPAFTKVIEDVDISTLDEGHVLPNMKPPVGRGIWFPIGYD